MRRSLDLYWLAGLLEGEGSFVAGPPSAPTVPRIQLPMTDRDVVARAAHLFDRRFWRSDRGIELGCKPVFLTAIKGAAAVQLMSALRPIMGVRRQGQIDRALVRPHSDRPRWYRRPLACAAPRCRRLVHAKGLCKVHYDSWWKARKRGHAYRYAPIDAPMPAGIDSAKPLLRPAPDTPAALAWLAGLLEGEGTFEAHRQGRRTYPRLSLQMCDEDVVVRVASLIDAPSVWCEAPQREGAYEPLRLSPQEGCVVTGCAAPHDSRGLCHRHHTQWWRDVRAGREPRVTPLR